VELNLHSYRQDAPSSVGIERDAAGTTEDRRPAGNQGA
jgi:hypothetical protein